MAVVNGSRGDRPLVRRFTRTERAVHWVLAFGFFALLASGLVLYLPKLSVLVARRPLVKEVHLYTGVAWLVMLALVIAVGNRKSVIATLGELDRFDEDDRRWLRGRPSSPGRFNAGQKLNAAVTAAFTLLFAVSGFLLWYGERDTHFRFAGTILLHDGLMYVSLALLAGHLYLAVIRPATRHSLRGITTGYVRADWARRRHPRWIAQLELDRDPGEARQPGGQPHQLARRQQDAEGNQPRAGGEPDHAPVPAERAHEAEAAREQEPEEQEGDPETEGVDGKQHRTLRRMPFAGGQG
jgi:formate dehydrogenase subunit gamma